MDFLQTIFVWNEAQKIKRKVWFMVAKKQKKILDENKFSNNALKKCHKEHFHWSLPETAMQVRQRARECQQRERLHIKNYVWTSKFHCGGKNSFCNFWLCGWNPMVLPFKRNLSSSTFALCYSFFCIFITRNWKVFLWFHISVKS